MNPKTRTSPRRISGVTLLELLTVTAIIGILSAIAIPSYQDYVRRGQIEEATATLSQGRVATEQYFLDNRTFVGVPCPVGTDNFALTCAATATTYTITATGAGNLSSFVFTINERNQRSTAGPWGSGACWVMKKGQTC
jgi:type IV pilus assembly protein PilE